MGRLEWKEKKNVDKTGLVQKLSIQITKRIARKQGGKAQCTQDLSKNCTNKESVSPFSPLIRGFRNK